MPINYLFLRQFHIQKRHKQDRSIYEINANLNVMSKTNLKKVLSFIDIIDG